MLTPVLMPLAPPLLRVACLWGMAFYAFQVAFDEALARLRLPRPGSIITLACPILDENGDELPVGLDVVAVECRDDGSILVSADQEDETEVSAWVHPGEGRSRAEVPEVRGAQAPEEGLAGPGVLHRWRGVVVRNPSALSQKGGARTMRMRLLRAPFPWF